MGEPEQGPTGESVRADAEPRVGGCGRPWVHTVAVDVEVLRGRVAVLAARAGAAATTDHELRAVDAARGSIEGLLGQAVTAMHGEQDSWWRRRCDWWNGRRLELAFHYLHAAEAQLCELYDDVEVRALVPETLARIDAVLPADDPRVRAARELVGDRGGTGLDGSDDDQPDVAVRRSQLRQAVEAGHAAADRQHSRVRNFRNAVFVAGLVMIALAALVVGLLSWSPSWIPLCFDGPTGGTVAVCPTGANGEPTPFDALVVVLLGVLGGAVAAALAIRNLRGTSTPYDIPVALAWLKLPLGGLTALVGLIAIRGEFVPGLSALDSQEQILAYALILGYAQQALTMRIDRQAREVLDGLPGGEPQPAAAERIASAGRPVPAT